MVLVSRDRLVELVRGTSLDEFDVEDTGILVDILLEAFEPYFILTWLFWVDQELETTPLLAIEHGHIRMVIDRARRMVAGAA